VATNPTREHREIYYSGWVQGVGFRYTTRRLATRFPVTGFVRNLSDGRVELVAEGLPTDVDRFLAAVRDEFGTQIRDIEERSAPATGEFSTFEIRR
jgi:acylphosphatase